MAETQRDNEETNATTSVGKTENFVSKHFVRLLVWLAVSGGALAIFGPWLLYVAGWTGETDANLRLHILYVTGGTIAVLGLVETHRKNTTDRIKTEADIQNYQASQNYQSKTLDEQTRQFTENIAKEREKIEADKAKNEQDHIRQVHAERRSRYTTAIEQLSNDKASIRLGGVYTLVGLVDEWLTDEKTIPNIEERRKEGQVIINNLCAYIRSPFLLAERAVQLDEPYAKDLQNDFDGDKEKFDADKRSFTQEKSALEEERQIRQSIIKEMREHLHNDEGLVHWSYFDYDFSNAYFFYFTDFTRSHFDGSLNFTGAEFTGFASFSGAEFTEADFSGVEFTQNADFSKAEFTGFASFSGAEFTEVSFFRAEFTGFASFSGRNSPRLASLGRNSPGSLASPGQNSPRTLTSPGQNSPRTLTSTKRNSPRLTSPRRNSPRTLTSPRRNSPEKLTSPGRNSPRTLTSPGRNSPGTLTSPGRNSPRTLTSPGRNSPGTLTSPGRNSPGSLASPRQPSDPNQYSL